MISPTTGGSACTGSATAQHRILTSGLGSLKNPSHPEHSRRTQCGVMCIDLSPAHPQMVVAGLYDGNVAVWDLTLPSTQPTILGFNEPDHTDQVR